MTDISHIAQMQLHQGIHEITSWTDMITIHPIARVQSLQKLQTPEVGLIIIVEMSSSKTLINDSYREKVLKISLENPQVIGVIGQQKIDDRFSSSPLVYIFQLREMKKDNNTYDQIKPYKKANAI